MLNENWVYIDRLIFGTSSITMTRRGPEGNRIWVTTRGHGSRRASWRLGDQYGSESRRPWPS